MTIQTFNDYTDIKWLYNQPMTIQTLNIIQALDIRLSSDDNTDIKWQYRH